MRLAIGMLALVLSSVATLAADPQRPEISFAVHHLNEENVEGPNVERTYIMAGGKRIVFGKPQGQFQIDGGGMAIFLKEAGLNGEIKITHSTLTPETELAENALKYRDAAAATMPSGATHAEMKQPVMDPYPFNGWQSLGFAWTYSFFGQPMVRTVNYINLEMGVQIMVTTVAAKNDNEKVEKVAKQFISSWWIMKG